MLICSVFTDEKGEFSKLITSPEVTDMCEKDIVELALTREQADQIEALYQISLERE